MTQIFDKHTSFNMLFNRYYAGLCVYAEYFLGDRQAAEDMVQDVFVSIWMKRAELNFNETICSYLYRAVHNVSIQFLRQLKVRERYNAQVITKLTEAELIPAEWIAIDTNPTETNEIQTLYQQALYQLPAQTREIFLCSREKEMKYSEIAEQTGLSVKSIEYHISKALDVFRNVLKDYLWIMIMLTLSK
jgi:RNA polymerase sigma-70 factor (ECF subfamily)